MACGYAKYTGRLGCCLATSGPGGIHLLNGLYDAKLDGAPVAGHHRPAIPRSASHLHATGCGAGQALHGCLRLQCRVMGPAHVENVTELACRTALAYRGVSHITIPTTCSPSPCKTIGVPRATSRITSRTICRKAPTCRARPHLQVASEILNEGKKVCILAGRGALHARDQLAAMAERLGAPVVKAAARQGRAPRRQRLRRWAASGFSARGRPRKRWRNATRF